MLSHLMPAQAVTAVQLHCAAHCVHLLQEFDSGTPSEYVKWDAHALMPLWASVLRPIFAARAGEGFAAVMDTYHRVDNDYPRMFSIFQVTHHPRHLRRRAAMLLKPLAGASCACLSMQQGMTTRFMIGSLLLLLLCQSGPSISSACVRLRTLCS